MKTTFVNEIPYKVLLSPVVTEKSTTLGEGVDGNGIAYVFNVASDATKIQIKQAIEQIFSVKVENVRVHNLKGKPRNLRHRHGGSRRGRKPTQRRAFVSLKEGFDIDFWKISQGDS